MLVLKNEDTTVLAGLWTLELAWNSAETNLQCAGSRRIYMPSPNIVPSIVSEITAFIRTDGHG